MVNNNNLKSDLAYKSIGETAKELNLIDKKTGKLQTHTLRYWEKQFKQIRPLIKAGKRRYYSKNDLDTIKLIHFLLKEKGLKISGAKKILNNRNNDTLDPNLNKSINSETLKKTKKIKDKLINIKKILLELNKYK
jgi:DNA-binding transcriptional MerR regulator